MGLQKKKLVFLDIDGTLIPRSQKMSEKTIQALRQAHDNGHILSICTGRTYCEMPEEMKRFDAIVSAAGACIMWKNEILLAEYFSDREKEQVAGLLSEAGAFYSLEGLDKVYMERKIFDALAERISNGEERWLQRVFERSSSCDDIKKMERVHKFSFFCAVKDNAWLRERLREWNMSVAAFSQGDARGSCGEITKTAFHKGSALRYLSGYLGIPTEDTIAIGDSENDLGMIQAAGIGIAMGNAADYVKEAADDVTASIEEEGVYHAFRKYGLIP